MTRANSLWAIAGFCVGVCVVAIVASIAPNDSAYQWQNVELPAEGRQRYRLEQLSAILTTVKSDPTLYSKAIRDLVQWGLHAVEQRSSDSAAVQDAELLLCELLTYDDRVATTVRQFLASSDRRIVIRTAGLVAGCRALIATHREDVSLALKRWQADEEVARALRRCQFSDPR